MKQAIIYAGITGLMKELGMNDAERLIEKYLTDIAHNFGGYTKQVCTGGWMDGDKLVQDTTLRIEVLLTHAHHQAQIEKQCKWMATDFGEDCVLLTVLECTGQFIQGGGV